MLTIEEKVVVVTGAGAGIGRAIAELFAERGGKVAVTDIDTPGGRSTVDKIVADGGDAVFFGHDVASEEGWIRVLAETKEHFGGIDVLVNNAGIYFIAPVTEISLEQWDRLFSINVTGTFLGAKHVVRYLVERGGGSIINLSSVAGLLGAAGHACYGASKGAVRILTKDLAAELGAQNIRVNSVHPTYVRTEMADYGAATAGKTLEELGRDMSVLGRIAEPEDVANVVAFLAADESRYLTGAELVVDGGGGASVLTV